MQSKAFATRLSLSLSPEPSPAVGGIAGARCALIGTWIVFGQSLSALEVLEIDSGNVHVHVGRSAEQKRIAK
jgi:hypothetical protein